MIRNIFQLKKSSHIINVIAAIVIIRWQGVSEKCLKSEWKLTKELYKLDASQEDQVEANEASE